MQEGDQNPPRAATAPPAARYRRTHAACRGAAETAGRSRLRPGCGAANPRCRSLSTFDVQTDFLNAESGQRRHPRRRFDRRPSLFNLPVFPRCRRFPHDLILIGKLEANIKAERRAQLLASCCFHFGFPVSRAASRRLRGALVLF